MLQVTLGRVSNRADWSDVIELTDAETGEGIDLAAATILIEVTDDCDRRVLSGSTTDGKVGVIAMGQCEFTFPRQEMIRLCPGTYHLGCTVTIGDETDQIFIGTVPVVDGVVQR